jgi:hypothetical protein
LCRIAAVSARMRCMTRATTPPGVRPRCRSWSSCPTILDTLVLVSVGTPWTTPPGGTSVIPATAHPRGETRRREEAAEPPAYRRDLRLHPFHDRDDRGRSAGDQSRKGCRQAGLRHEVAARTLVRSCRGRGAVASSRHRQDGGCWNKIPSAESYRCSPYVVSDIQTCCRSCSW